MTENGHDGDRSLKDRLIRRLRQAGSEADKGREPELLQSRGGRRQISVRALMERIITQFIDEHGAGESEAFQSAETEADRLKLILAATDYVIAVESVSVSASEKADIIRAVYAEMFTYGPLDKLIADERITTISLEGADKAAVRYGHGELESLDPIFDNEQHLKRIVNRLLEDSGIPFESEPIVETGLTVGGRRISINVVLPPVTILTSVDIRLHPLEAPTLDALVKTEFLTEDAARAIEALAQSEHGVVVVGDTESGKTTLLGVFASLVPERQREKLVAIERAGEMALPDDAERLIALKPIADAPGEPFSVLAGKALSMGATCLLLDEVRIDEAYAVGELLETEQPIRQLWAFRGPANSKRLASALGMLARRSKVAVDSEKLVMSLYHKMPFMVTVRRNKGKIGLHSISEWQFPDGAEYPDHVELFEKGWEQVEKTGKRPQRQLNLPDDFWET